MGVVAYLSLSGSGREVGWGGRLLTFSAFRMGAYSRWAIIRGWALIQINTVPQRVSATHAIFMKLYRNYLISDVFVPISLNRQNLHVLR